MRHPIPLLFLCLALPPLAGAAGRELSGPVVRSGTIAQDSRRTVSVLGATSASIGELADSVFSESRARHGELVAAGDALLDPPVVEETFQETAVETVLESKVSFTVVDPDRLRRRARRFQKFRRRNRDPKVRRKLGLKNLSPKARKRFERYRQRMLEKPKRHPMRKAAEQGDDALIQAVGAGKGDLTITTRVVVPKARPMISPTGTIAVPMLQGDTLSYTSSETRTVGFATSGKASAIDSVMLAGETTSGSKKTTSKFLTGFTDYQSFKWVERWDFGSKDYFKIKAEAGYAFGLRVPVEVTGTLEPSKIHRSLGTDQDSEVKVELTARAFDAGEGYYEDTGLKKAEVRDGQEFVLEADAFVKVDLVAGWGTIEIHKKIPEKLGIDWGKNLKPAWDDCGTKCGVDLWVPASITRTELNILGIVVGKAQLGVNLSGTGSVDVDYEALVDGQPVDSKKGGSTKRTHRLHFTSSKSQTLTATVPKLTSQGSRKYGYQVSDPSYTWGLVVTPGVKGSIDINARPFFSEHIPIGPFWLDAAALKLGSVTFRTHAGTTNLYKTQKGEKTWGQATAVPVGTMAAPATSSAAVKRAAPRLR